MDSILKPNRGGFLFAMAAFVVVIAGLKAAQDIVLLVLAAAFVAVAIAPAIYYLHSKGVPFGIGLGLVMTAALGIFGFMAGIVGSSANDFRRQLPVYEARLRQGFNDVSDYLADYGVALELDRLAGDLIDPGKFLDLAANLFTGVGSILANGFLIFIMVIFLLLEMESFPEKLRAAFGGRGTTVKRFRELGSSVNRYLVIKTWVSLMTGFIAGTLCWIVGVDFALLWGLLAFLLNYVPNIGSIVAAVPPCWPWTPAACRETPRPSWRPSSETTGIAGPRSPWTTRDRWGPPSAGAIATTSPPGGSARCRAGCSPSPRPGSVPWRPWADRRAGRLATRSPRARRGCARRGAGRAPPG